MAKLTDHQKIRKELVHTLSSLVDDVEDAANRTAVRLESVVLFGSAVGNAYITGKSDVNVYMVFDSIRIELLHELRPIFARYVKRLKTRPLIVDSMFVQNSAAVFPMEFFEWQERGRVVYGRDLLEGIEVPMGNLLYQVKENLKGKRMKMIQAYLETEPGKKQLQPLLHSTIPGMLTVFRNVLRIMGHAANRDAVGLIDAIEEKGNLKLTNFRRFHRMKVDGVRIGRDELDILFRDYMQEMIELEKFVETLEPQE